jgi:hypothetical protein
MRGWSRQSACRHLAGRNGLPGVLRTTSHLTIKKVKTSD